MASKETNEKNKKDDICFPLVGIHVISIGRLRQKTLIMFVIYEYLLVCCNRLIRNSLFSTSINYYFLRKITKNWSFNKCEMSCVKKVIKQVITPKAYIIKSFKQKTICQKN